MTKAAVAWGDGVGIGAVADRELHAVLGDQVLGGGFVVRREGGDRGAYAGEAVRRPLEGPQLGVAVGHHEPR